MGERRPSGPLLDETIDRAVRGMMDVDARPGFERRVMRRLDETPARPLAWTRLAAAAAGLAVIVLATLFLRDTPDQPSAPRQEPVAAAQPSSPADPTSIAPAIAPQSATLDGPESRPRAHRRPPADPVANAANVATMGEAPTPMIAALQEPSALSVDSIAQPRVNVSDIAMTTIQIPTLTVEALAPRDGMSRE